MKASVITTSIVIIAFALIAIIIGIYDQTTAITTMTLGLAAVTSLIAANTAETTAVSAENSRKQTEESLKLTKLTIKKTEIMQQIKDIEDSLNNFYHPLRIYLDKDNNRYREEIAFISQHRHLATKDTRAEFEKFRQYGDSPAKQGILSKCVDKDTESLMNELEDKKDQLKNYYSQI